MVEGPRSGSRGAETAGGVHVGAVTARRGRWPTWGLLGAWAVIGVGFEAISFEISGPFGLFERLWMSSLWLAFAGVVGWGVVCRVRPGAWAGSVVFACVAAALGVGFHERGPRIGRLARFCVLKSTYETMMSRRDPAMRVDEGLPARMAFAWGDGVLDNWCGVVYDPSGLVASAARIRPDLSNLHDPALKGVTGLFGGDLCYCEPLGGPWYFCCFT